MRAVDKTIIALIGIELVITIASYIVLPDVCAVHWSQKGTDYRDKITIFVLPLIAALTAGLSIAFSRWYMKRSPEDGEVLYYVFLLMSFIIIAFTYIGLILILAANL